MFYLLLPAVAALGVTLGLRIGTPVYNSKSGTACGVTLCCAAFVLLIWQLFLLPYNILPLRIALAAMVLVMTTCSAAEASTRAGKPTISVRQLACAVGGILVFAIGIAMLVSL